MASCTISNMIWEELKKNRAVYIFIALYFVGLAVVLNWSTLTQLMSFRHAATVEKTVTTATTSPTTYQNALMSIDSVWFPTGWNLTESPNKLNFGFVSQDQHTAIIGLLYPADVASNLQTLYAANEKTLRDSGITIRSHFTKKIGAREWLFYEYQTTGGGRTLMNRDAITSMGTHGVVRFMKLRLVSDADTFQANVPMFDHVISTLVFSK